MKVSGSYPANENTQRRERKPSKSSSNSAGWSALKSHATIGGQLVRGPAGGQLKPDTVRTILINRVLNPLKKQIPSATGERGFADGCLHSFRHFFVSQAFLEGASIGEIKDWVGHRDSKIVDHCRHLGDDESRQRMERLNLLGDIDLNPDGPGSPMTAPMGAAVHAKKGSGRQASRRAAD